jgi:putative tryptophan/tyrosine transport system substrate-binding protein
MKRREFITLVGGAAVWPLAARAQQGQHARRIGMLIAGAESDPEARRRIAALLQTLDALGWVNERNITFEYRWETSSLDRFSSLAQELVDLQPDLLIGISSTPAVIAFKKATHSIPIVFVNITDPVNSRIVETLAHPDGNATGFTNFEYQMVGKWMEFLKELSPQVFRIVLLFNPVTAPHAQVFMSVLEPAAKKISVELMSMPVRSPGDIATAIGSIGGTAGNGLIVANDAFTSSNRKLIIGLANQHKIPAIYPFRFFATDGGLISYGVDQIDIFRRSASYVDRILKGEKPANLPVQQPTKFELVINLQTAKALNLDVPPTLLASADDVIE